MGVFARPLEKVYFRACTSGKRRKRLREIARLSVSRMIRQKSPESPYCQEGYTLLGREFMPSFSERSSDFDTPIWQGPYLAVKSSVICAI